MDEELLRQEREILREYLLQRKTNLEDISLEIGEENLTKLILDLVRMDKFLKNAEEAAKLKNFESTVELTVQGRLVKDNFYSVLANAYGGMPALLRRGLDGTPTLLRDYVLQKYDSCVTRCENTLYS